MLVATVLILPGVYAVWKIVRNVREWGRKDWIAWQLGVPFERGEEYVSKLQALGGTKETFERQMKKGMDLTRLAVDDELRIMQRDVQEAARFLIDTGKYQPSEIKEFMRILSAEAIRVRRERARAEIADLLGLDDPGQSQEPERERGSGT